MPNDKLLTSKQTQEKLGISNTSLWRLVKAKKLPQPIKLTPNGYNLYKESWINTFIAGLEAGGTPC